MNDLSPNLFDALFEFFPRDGHSPKENFLSEGLAYVLKTCDEARDAWLTLALGQPSKSKVWEITTRQTAVDEAGTAVFPDMRASGVLHDGKPFDLYSEHKWDSPCKPAQIQTYLKIAQQRGNHCRVVFIGASRRQKKQAESADARMNGNVFLWADVFQALDRIPKKADMLIQFLDFMKTHGLSPGRPIDSATMVAFIQSADFLTTLEHCANKLNDDFGWDFLPKRYRTEGRAVTDRWGRIGIEFATPEWRPTITVGFLIDERDHRVAFVNRQQGIDLLLRIEASASDQKNIEPALAELDRKRKKLSGFAASALLLRERGNGNNHSLLIVQHGLADVIENVSTQHQQLEAIYNTLKRWGEILFADGMLEKAFKRAGLDSGM